MTKPRDGIGAEMRQAGIDAGLYDNDDSFYKNVVRGKPRDLGLAIPGARPEAIERGLVVARAVLSEAGIDPDFAEYASRRERDSQRGDDTSKLRQEHVEAAAAFRLAEAAALDAALGSGAVAPEGTRLFIRVIF